MKELHCNGHTGKPKRRFDNQNEARQWRLDHHQTTLIEYPCPDCKKWHLRTSRRKH